MMAMLCMPCSTSIIIAIIIGAAVLDVSVVDGCPFASSSLAGKQQLSITNFPKNHPPIRPTTERLLQQGESLIGLDGRLVGSPSLDNGAADYPSLLQPVGRESTVTVADWVANLSTTMGEELCLIRFQQLPPPAEGNFSFDQNATDRFSLKVYGDIMVQRFNDLSSPDLVKGGIIHASTTIGYGGIASMCNAGIEPDRFCNLTSAVRWPQAVTGYKLTNETVDAVKEAIMTWRTTDQGHLPSMLWSFLGGDPENGGSQVGIWGNNGGLFSKIVKCADIPESLLYYEYPDGIATSDYIDPTTGRTVSDMMYEWWASYGAIDPETGEQVFGEAPKLPEECRPCIESIPCFTGRGCNFLDLATQSWSGLFEACGPAFGCSVCFPECVAEREIEGGSEDDQFEGLCMSCKEAIPCFDETGCSFFDSESQAWSPPFQNCTAALPCIDLGCFEVCMTSDDPMTTMNGTDTEQTGQPAAPETGPTEAPMDVKSGPPPSAFPAGVKIVTLLMASLLLHI